MSNASFDPTALETSGLYVRNQLDSQFRSSHRNYLRKVNSANKLCAGDKIPFPPIVTILNFNAASPGQP